MFFMTCLLSEWEITKFLNVKISKKKLSFEQPFREVVAITGSDLVELERPFFFHLR